MELLYKRNITHAFVLLVLVVALCTVYSLQQHFCCDSLHINCNPECNKHSMEWQNFKKCRFEQLDILLFYDIYFLRKKNRTDVPFPNADIPEPDQPEYCSYLLYLYSEGVEAYTRP